MKGNIRSNHDRYPLTEVSAGICTEVEALAETTSIASLRRSTRRKKMSKRCYPIRRMITAHLQAHV